MPSDTFPRIGDRLLRISHFYFPQMAQRPRLSEGFDLRRFTGLRALFVGGAPLLVDQARPRQADGMAVIKGYGMSVLRGPGVSAGPRTCSTVP